MRESPFSYDGIQVACDPDVYRPSDDTLLLLKALEGQAPGRFLEVGTGTGLVSIAAARAGHRVTATDLHGPALRLAGRNAQKNNVDIHRVRADLFNGIRVARFDLVAFNPPYLPTGEAERVPGPLNDAFDGGPTGRRVLERFLQQLPADCPPVLLVASDLQDSSRLTPLIHHAGLQSRTLASARFDHETIHVLLLTSEKENRRAQKD